MLAAAPEGGGGAGGSRPGLALLCPAGASGHRVAVEKGGEGTGGRESC